MNKRNLLKLLFASVAMLVLILDGQTAVNGIRNGIDICLRTLIPSLFPFFVLSGLITSTLIGQPIPGMKQLASILKIPVGSESLFVTGLLGGYPVGAKIVHDAYVRGALTKDEAQRISVFCNNPGPSFVFGILGPVFPNLSWVWLLWLIHIYGAIITGILLPGGSRRIIEVRKGAELSLSESLNQSIRSVASVCGWVVLFRMILEFLNKWCLWILPAPIRVLLSGFLELANGCLELSSIGDPLLILLLAVPMLAFGGLCILMQTKSVFPVLNIRQYVCGKLLQTVVVTFMTMFAAPILTENFPAVPAIMGTVLAVSFLVLYRNRKKEVAIPT